MKEKIGRWIYQYIVKKIFNYDPYYDVKAVVDCKFKFLDKTWSINSYKIDFYGWDNLNPTTKIDIEAEEIKL